jgi:hypothetical protein
MYRYDDGAGYNCSSAWQYINDTSNYTQCMCMLVELFVTIPFMHACGSSVSSLSNTVIVCVFSMHTCRMQLNAYIQCV